MPQILHLAFWKTGTTGLQRLVFRRGTLPYHGVNDGTPPAVSRAWLEDLRTGSLDVAWTRRDFVFSNESGLVRLGGWTGLSDAVQRIADTFADPRVLFTVREPASLLASVYVQSLRVRRAATGDLSDARSYRFLAFDQWWRLLRSRADRSLAGLLDFNAVADHFRQRLGARRVTILPIESLRTDVATYRRMLCDLGFGADSFADFLAHPPLNATAERLLRRRPVIGSRLGVMPGFVDHPGFDLLHRLGRQEDVLASHADVVAEIRSLHPYDPVTLLSPRHEAAAPA